MVAQSQLIEQASTTAYYSRTITETFNSARKSWLKWALEHVEVVWPASWSPEKILHEYPSGLHASECPSRFASARVRPSAGLGTLSLPFDCAQGRERVEWSKGDEPS
jgi:hypothetical protein